MKQQTSLSLKLAPPGPQSRGNATIYVLIVVALFAALGFILTRQSGTSESAHLSDNQADLIAGQILAYPATVKQAVDRITMTGTDPSDLNFTLPGDPAFNSSPTLTKVFHPDGGGLSLATLPADAVSQSSTNPPAGWYLSMFNNVDWSYSSANDVMLVAWQISKDVCQRINLKLTGATTIPALNDTIPDLLINKEYPPGNSIHTGTNSNFTYSNCAGCVDKPALCVVDSSGVRYGYYSMIVNQ